MVRKGMAKCRCYDNDNDIDTKLNTSETDFKFWKKMLKKGNFNWLHP